MTFKFLEIIGFVSGILGVWLTMKKNKWCFPIGLINVTVSLYLFYLQGLYADSLQQIVYMILLLYGWITWNRSISQTQPKLLISRLNSKEIIYSMLIIVLTTILLGTTLAKYTDAKLPFLDSFATSCAFLAQYFIARKKIETWILWMIVNVIYTGIYMHNEMFLYVGLFTIYGILTVMGWKSWRIELKNPLADVAH
ncbi:MAG: nicotinamide mononucleotide transporter [Bacteroidia bacterium]|jgi:nicotinamide mononucleotide transporter|nr:nicotinamide mononucleotide transporter [Bacteroidia bacterium]MBP7245318.1 nicotinamide mononucleotide transporter [Bacteroidia bacterium]